MKLAIPIALALLSVGTSACSWEPHGTEVADSEIVQILRPSLPITQEHLLRSGDDAYYVATLSKAPPPVFTRQYVAELERRGFYMTASGTSAHAPIQRIQGYYVSFVREAELDPYTIKYKGAWQGDADPGVPRSLSNYAFPVSVRGSVVVVKMPAALLDRWHVVVVVPKTSLATPPDGLPLPPGAVIVGSFVERGNESRLWKGESVVRGDRLQTDFIAPQERLTVMDGYRTFCQGGNWRFSVESSGDQVCRFDHAPPPWSHGAAQLTIAEDTFLFVDNEAHVAVAAVAYATHPSVPRAAGGTGQPESLMHVPDAAHRYRAVLSY